jgi:hypothetical protein
MIKYQKLISFDNSLSYMPDVASAAIMFATTLPTPGIYNLCSPGHSNAREIVDMMGIEKEFFTEEEFNKATVAPRSNCILSTTKLESIFEIRSVKEALKQAIGNLK